MTDAMAEDYRRRFRPKAPIYAIPNGFDEDDFTNIASESRGRFTVVYAGKFYEGRDPYVFVEGVRRALAAGAFGADDIEIRFIGVVPEDIRAGVTATGLPITIRGHVTHREAIIGEGPAMETTLTGKIFEYIRAGRPVIALVPPTGVAAKLIGELDAGYVVRPADAGGVAAALTDLYGRYRRGELERPKAPHPGLEQYTRREIARRYAGLLDSLIDE